jgi:hypothetical protein
MEPVTFHNEENGFCVLRVEGARGQRDLITVLGHAPMISAGDACELVQFRPAVVARRGRADVDIVFDLAVRLGSLSISGTAISKAALDHHLAPVVSP